MTVTYTHMPFIFTNNGNEYLLFGGQNRGTPWRLYWSLLRVWDPRPISTGSSLLSTECAPAAFLEGDLIRLSAMIDYRLCRFEGYTLDTLSPIAKDEKTYFSGVVTPTNIFRASHDFVEMYDAADNFMQNIDVLRYGMAYMKLVRLSFVPADPDLIIVTGTSVTTGHRSILYSLSRDRAWLIQVAGQDVYKCALTSEALYYVTGPDLQRVVTGTGFYDLIPL